MESEVKVVNIMRVGKLNMSIPLEECHRNIPSKLYTGRPEMLLILMSNGRNVQLFRQGTIQILGAISDQEAHEMLSECLQLLRQVRKMRTCALSMQLTIKNLVLKFHFKTTIYLNRIQSSNHKICYDATVFPAAMVTKWSPAHVSIFPDGKVILTGVKTLDAALSILTDLRDYCMPLIIKREEYDIRKATFAPEFSPS